MSLSYRAYRLKRRFGCKHDGGSVAADISEGDGGDAYQVEWCRRCGAYRFCHDPWGHRPRFGEWRIPSRWWDR